MSMEGTREEEQHSQDHHHHHQQQQELEKQQQQHHHHHRRRRHHPHGRSIIVSVDHSATSKHAFDWSLSHLCHSQDTLYLLHILPKSQSNAAGALFESTSALMEKLAVEAYEAGMVQTEVQIISAEEVGKAIVDEAKRINPIAVVMGRPARGIVKSVLHGSVGEYCSHHCPCPVVLVPPGGKTEKFFEKNVKHLLF